MKTLLRVFIFTCLSINVAQYVVGGLVFGGGFFDSYVFYAMALAILFFFLKPVLKFIGLPDEGIAYVFMLFVSAFIVTLVLTTVIQMFSLRPVELTGLTIFGFQLPSKSLTAFWAGLFSALLIGGSYAFFDWLCAKKR